LDTSGFVFWTNYKRVKHSDVLSENFQQLVIDWWTSETIVFPNQKNVVKLKTSMKQFEVAPNALPSSVSSNLVS
jgi:pyridoxine/pyridoxamine 5'-phosphate oxidase